MNLYRNVLVIALCGLFSACGFKNSKGTQFLGQAAIKGDYKRIDKILKRQAEYRINVPASVYELNTDETPLSVCVGDSRCDLQMVKYLIGKGADLWKMKVIRNTIQNRRAYGVKGDEWRRHALHVAATANRADVINYLIEEQGVDVDLPTKIRSKGELVEDQSTPLWECLGGEECSTETCAKKCSVEVLRMLMNKGASPWRRGRHVLHEAARGGRADIVRLFVEERGVDADLLTRKALPDTPLLLAAHWGHLEALDALLELGANPDQQNEKGQGFEALFRIAKRREAKAAAEREAWSREYDRKEAAKARKKKARGNFLAKAVVVGAVAGIASTSGLSAAQQAEVVTATAMDVNSNGGTSNLDALSAKYKSQGNSYRAARKAGSAAPVRRKVRPCSSSDGACATQVWESCRVGTEYKCVSAKVIFENGMWRYVGNPQANCAKKLGSGRWVASFSNNSAFAGGQQYKGSNPQALCLSSLPTRGHLRGKNIPARAASQKLNNKTQGACPGFDLATERGCRLYNNCLQAQPDNRCGYRWNKSSGNCAGACDK
jgi:hypothetical protein